MDHDDEDSNQQKLIAVYHFNFFGVRKQFFLAHIDSKNSNYISQWSSF